jgi:hypothetical protein
MGFPEIMYLSKSQVRNMWPNLDTKNLKPDEFSAKASLSLNPTVEFGGKWSTKKSTRKDDVWPPWDSREVVKCIDEYVQKSARVGLWSDVYDNPDKCDFYLLEGKLKFADSSPPDNEFRFGRLKTQSIDAVFCGELPKDQLAVSLSLENIAGIDRLEGEWEVWESGAHWMLHAMSQEGFESRGLFTLMGRNLNRATSARIVYLTPRQTYG